MKQFIEVQEIDNPYPCYVDIWALESTNEEHQLITFHNKTTLQLTNETFVRVVERLKKKESGLNETERTN